MSVAYDAEPTGAQLSQDQENEQRRDMLLRALKREEEDALGFAQTEIIEQQLEALRRYFGEKYGDEEDGRSQVTTREVFETIEWTRPDLMRVFASGGTIVNLEELQPEDAKYSNDAAAYLDWIFFNDNPGFENLDAFAFDGLLHRRGYMCCYWRTKEYRAPQTLTGLNIQQVQMLMQDPGVEIIGQDFDQESEAGGINLIVRRVKSPARAEIEVVAPEDMRLSGRAVDIDKSRYVGRVIRMLRGEVERMFPDMAEEIRGLGNSFDGHRRGEDVRQERFGDTDDWEDGEGAAAEVEVLEEYLRIDLNDDGYPETIRSYRIKDLLLEESEVEENPFGSWTPIRIPHRFMGLSFHDITHDLQRRSTVLTRASLDATYQSVVNREAYDKNRVDLDPLLATYSGAKVPVDGDPATAIKSLTGGLDTAGAAYQALEMLQRNLEDRTGATRQTRGLDPKDLSGEHSGVALDKLQINADARKEMVARNMAAGLSAFFSKLYRLVCRNQNEARAAKVGGKWAQFDPRTWNSDLRVTIYAGGVNREAALMGLQLIGAEQDKVIDVLGVDNPMVPPSSRFAYQEELCRLAGKRSAAPYFMEPPEQPETDEQGQPVMDPQTGGPKMKPWAPPPQEDPAMAKVKADAQAKQAELQLKAQDQQATTALKTEEAKANLQLQGQKDAATLQAQQEKAALDLQLAREKAAAEIQLANDKARAEIELAWAKFEAEIALAREKQAAEIALAREQMSHQREMHSEDTQTKREMHSEKVDADIEISSNRKGGSLSE